MSLIHRLIDLIFPPRCPACGLFIGKQSVEDDPFSAGVCPSCRADIHPLNPPYCTVCGLPFVSKSGGFHVCEICLREPPLFHALGAPYLYEGTLKTVIHLFKYGGRSGLVSFLGPLVASFARTWAPAQKASLVMPVPLHPRRLRERGFNQSKLLAGHVSRALGTGMDFLSLRRVKSTASQTGLGKKDRRKNVRGAFDLSRPERIRGRTVLLVDDVATTGTTLNECARVLLKAKADQVVALVVGRTASL